MRSLPSNKQSASKSRRCEWNGHAVLCAVGLWLISLTPAWGQLASQSPQAESAGSAAQKPASADQLAFFESRIRPVLVKHCYECHSSGSSALKGGLRVDWAGGLTSGGDSGPSITPGHPEDSLLIDALEYDGMEMPPAGKLSADIVADFKAWIADGAIDPRQQPPTESAVPPKHQQLAASQLWSFQPVKKVIPPDVKATAWPTTAIDHFVLAKLEQAGIAPIEDADLSTLVRRLTFDLTGLPPMPAVVDRLANSSAEFDLTAYIDQLLDSEAYGQHWARHWLDVARYADSNGGDFNATFHEAWRYRNYVIAAFNDDKPFDQFIIQQIAGDLLPADNDQQRTEQLVASGFLMLGAKMLSERDKSKLQMDVVDEQVSIVGTAFMGLTLGCARCHDHKFDPISTQDYYALAGIFKSTYVLEGEIQKYVSNWIRSPLPISDEHRAQLDEYQTRSDALKARITKVEKLIKTLDKKAAAPTDAASPTTTPSTTTKPTSSTPTSSTPASSTPASSTPELVAPASDELTMAKAELEKLQAEMQALKKSAPPPAPLALAARDAKEIGDCQVCIRGEPHQLGPVVPRGFIGDLNYAAPPVFTKEQSGRVELAKWLADGRHLLTSRVIVNRIWKNLIGEGIVPSVDNFGALGEAPTHPELLDYLAHEFTTHQWSTKWLIREIVRSHVYQLSS
ncbi:MAG: PSD1 domain-containing protein, partial [Pirellulaceae bacterium]|nr:PSD1 domain-containing protein [Pirellulaceae bacterium]